MNIDDALLPAASYLTGPEASEVLRPAVVASGGELMDCQISQVQYRPQSDLVVRYRCVIRQREATTTATLCAGTTTNGPHEGTLPIEAETADGSLLRVGVWRWPFDPVLTDLEELVTPSSAAHIMSEFVGDSPKLEIVVYRPTERAVMRVSGSIGQVFVKILPPSLRGNLESRHAILLEAGIPVAQVLGSGAGWLAISELVGTTLRDRLKDPTAALPEPLRIHEMLLTLAAVQVDGATRARSRLDDAFHHAKMIATVAPAMQPQLDTLLELLDKPQRDPHTSCIHGDLHESQLVVDDKTVIGVLDIDDVGPGDPLDDVGTFLAHLEYRQLTKGTPRLRHYISEATSAFSKDHAPEEVSRHIAAALIGLATVPFTLQIPDWQRTTSAALEIAQRHLRCAG